VHCKKEPFDVYIGRPSKWGNPFTSIADKKTLAEFIVGSKEEAIEAFEKWVKSNQALMNSLHELRGKTLGCWCSPKACHGDVLVRLANEDLTIHNTGLKKS
jgi:hypothetical protein